MFLSSTAGCLFTGFILFIQVSVKGVESQATLICALNGSSVALPCAPPPPPGSSTRWHAVRWNGSHMVWSDFSTTANRTAIVNSTMTIRDLRESDARFYCCGSNVTVEHCWSHRVDLQVADLQVKVIPSAEGQTVTLMCSTSCALIGRPAAYIWYKNREFVYQDWSPWYQELVSSDPAVRYSCAIEGHEELRAPQVSVDSVTLTCFNVTYAKGRMCSYARKSVEEPCSITYPTEVQIQKTSLGDGYGRMTCTPSCALTDPQTAYSWFINDRRYKPSETRHLTVPLTHTVSCAVKGHDDLHSAQTCADEGCQPVDYASRRVCAAEGSLLHIRSSDITKGMLKPTWCKIKRSGRGGAESVTRGAGHQEYLGTVNHGHFLLIEGLRRNDSAEYASMLHNCRMIDTPGVMLVVTGLNVTVTPSAAVSEGQRVTLTCSTSCPLTDNTNYIWYLNGAPLTRPQDHNKHLLLDPVGSQHAGHYSCAVKTHPNIQSPEVTVSVEDLWNSMAIINAVRMMVVPLIPVPLLLFHLWMRRTGLSRASRQQEDPVQCRTLSVQ